MAEAKRQLAMYGFDYGTGRNFGSREGHNGGPLLPHSRWPSFFSRIVARLQWDANAIDLAEDAKAWPDLEDDRRERLTTLFAGFCVAEEAVADELTPFGDFMTDSLQAWVFYLQKRDEVRHAVFFDRIAKEILGVAGETAEERRAAIRGQAPPAILELFEERLPALSAEMAAGNAKLEQGVALYHMLLEGIVLTSGQQAILQELEDDALPGVKKGVEKVELDERWHIGFGLRCLVQIKPSDETLEELVAQADEAAQAWGDVIPDDIRERLKPMTLRRLHAAHLLESHRLEAA